MINSHKVKMISASQRVFIISWLFSPLENYLQFSLKSAYSQGNSVVRARKRQGHIEYHSISNDN